MRSIRYGVFAILLLKASGLHAQAPPSGSHSLFADWGITVPSKSSFTDRTTYVAPQLGYEYRLSAIFSAGITLGISHSNERAMTTDKYNGDWVDGNTHRKLTLIPLQVQFRCFPLGNGRTRLQPYLGLSGGVQYARFYLSGDAVQTAETSGWGGVITPHVGLRYSKPQSGLFFDLAVQWQSSSNEWKAVDSPSQRNIGVRLGVGYTINRKTSMSRGGY